MSDISQTINGELLRLRRESKGWQVSDLATRSCMSIKQIRQLEEGGSGSFYSESVKITSAKKVGGILGLTPEEVFGVPLAEESANDNTQVEGDAFVAEPEAESVSPATVVPVTPAQNTTDTSSEQKNKTPLGAIAALFVAAIAVAAWMRPEAEPVAMEPPPPLQTLPTETPDVAASAASLDVAVPAATGASAPASKPL